MTENEIAKIIVDTGIKIHSKLGPGLFESLYERILAYELKKRNLSVECQVELPVYWDDFKFDQGYRIDMIIGDKVLVELKSTDSISAVHFKQLQTYLKLTKLKLGLLMNFNENLLKDGIKRVVNNL